MELNFARISVPKQLRARDLAPVQTSIASRIQTIKTYRGNSSIRHDEATAMKRTKEDGAEVCLIALKEPINEVVGY